VWRGAARQRQGLEDAEKSQRRNETRVADLLPPSDTGDSALRIAGISYAFWLSSLPVHRANACLARVLFAICYTCIGADIRLDDPLSNNGLMTDTLRSRLRVESLL
jgi:hypothetical protein